MSALALFPPSSLSRANRGLLAEASATEEAGASLATGTKWRSASALAPISRRTVRKSLKKDECGVATGRKRVLTDGTVPCATTSSGEGFGARRPRLRNALRS